MKNVIIVISLLGLAACQTTQQEPNRNGDGLYVVTDTKGDTVLDKDGKERVIPLCPEKDENGKSDMSELSVDELATIVQFGCTPRE